MDTADELEYSEMAKSFAAGGHFLFRGQPSPIFGLYPALISPAWRAGSMHTTYQAAKLINVVMMTAAAVPFWFWARRLWAAGTRCSGTALFLALPVFGYTGVLMTKNAALPLFLFALFLIALVLEQPTLLRQNCAWCSSPSASPARSATRRSCSFSCCSWGT